MNTPAKIEQPLDRKTLGDMQVDQRGKFAGITFQTYDDIIAYSKAITHARYSLPEFLKGNAGDVLVLSEMAVRWRVGPAWVCQNAYLVEGQKRAMIAYNASVYSTVLNSSGLLKTRPRYTFTGEGGSMICTVSALFHGETEPHTLDTPPLGKCKRHSPLWEHDPKQQLRYYAIRSFARAYVPELLAGVYDREEAAEIVGRKGENPIPKRTLDDLVGRTNDLVGRARKQLQDEGLDDEDIEDVMEDMGELEDSEFTEPVDSAQKGEDSTRPA